ncbi:MAG: hypothetical protein EU533_08405 [Promethearchaeota archaeon]|nr:MAG: hypothetical protein EU533_08405 [Candidatus Lokiarchaeota archaeon]
MDFKVQPIALGFALCLPQAPKVNRAVPCSSQIISNSKMMLIGGGVFNFPSMVNLVMRKQKS